jgi:methionine sulfoxide reductase heme-binding subunit
MSASWVESRALWYLTRGSGAISLLLLTAIVVLGVANVVRWSPGRTPRFVVQRVHRDLSLLALVFIALHVSTVVIDGFAPIRWIDAVVPFGSVYRPIWLGFGALALDLLVAIAITSLSGLDSATGYGGPCIGQPTEHGSWPSSTVPASGATRDRCG